MRQVGSSLEILKLFSILTVTLTLLALKELISAIIFQVQTFREIAQLSFKLEITLEVTLTQPQQFEMISMAKLALSTLSLKFITMMKTSTVNVESGST